MKSDIVKISFEDISFNSKIRVLEDAKDRNKLEEIGQKRGLILPSPDIAIFECIYAMIDEENKNKCTIPNEEVDKALDTLIGKAVDIDHLRKRTTGWWIDACRKNDEIRAYGAFWKSNFKEEYKGFKERADKEGLTVSFEAWGNRVYENNSSSYNLRDIHFAGGALLDKETPAFDKARVLEFAKIMTPPNEFIHNGELKMKVKCEYCDIEFDYASLTEYISGSVKCPNCSSIINREGKLQYVFSCENFREEAKFTAFDLQTMIRLMDEVECLTCKKKYGLMMKEIDFENSTSKVKCTYCNGEMQIEFTPSAKVTKKGKVIKQVSLSSIDNAGKNKCFHENEISDVLENSDLDDDILEEAFMNEVEYNFSEIDTSKKITYAERKLLQDEDFAAIKTLENKKTKKPRKIRMFPIHDFAHVKNSMIKLSKSSTVLNKLGISLESAKQKINKRERDLKMKNLLEKYKKGSVDEVLQEIAKVHITRELVLDELTMIKAKLDNKDSVTEDEIKTCITELAKEKTMTDILKKYSKATVAELIAHLETEITSAKSTMIDLQTKVNTFESEKAAADKAKRDSLIASRKTELAEFAKDMKDEDLLDEIKYENAKLKKENSDLKSGKKIETIVPDLTKGAANKDIKPEESKARDNVNRMAFPKS